MTSHDDMRAASAPPLWRQFAVASLAILAHALLAGARAADVLKSKIRKG